MSRAGVQRGREVLPRPPLQLGVPLDQWKSLLNVHVAFLLHMTEMQHVSMLMHALQCFSSSSTQHLEFISFAVSLQTGKDIVSAEQVAALRQPVMRRRSKVAHAKCVGRINQGQVQ